MEAAIISIYWWNIETSNKTNKSLVNYSKLLKDVVFANANVHASFNSLESLPKNHEENK
jgi:hypothetical protein